MIKRLLIVLIGLTVVFGGLFAWKYAGDRQSMARRSPPPPAVVASEKVRKESRQPTLSAVGSIVPTRSVIVSTEVAGLVKEIFFDSSQVVASGDRLVRLDDEVDRSELVALEADRKLAELTRDRAKRLVTDKLGSRSAFDEAQAALESAAARVETKRAVIRQKAIRAPFAGELGIREVNPGQYIGPGADIVPLIALDPIFAEFRLPERELAKIALGQSALVKVQAYPEREFDGTIQAISPSIEQTTRNVRVRALLKNPEHLLRPGMFAEVSALLPARETVLTLPEYAITFSPYGSSVFVIEARDGQSVVRRQQISTGKVQLGRIEILDGLHEGDEVVSAGQNKLRNGQAVVTDNSVELPELVREQ